MGSITKSQQEVDRLVHEVLLADDFRTEDLSGFSMDAQNTVLDAKSTCASDGWREVDVDIKIPTRTPDMTGGCHQLFTIPRLLYRPITDILKAAFSSPAAKHFHLFPFKWFWQHPIDGSKQRVFNELYTSNAWLKAHNDLQRQPNKPGCKLEKVVAAMMFSSDATSISKSLI